MVAGAAATAARPSSRVDRAAAGAARALAAAAARRRGRPPARRRRARRPATSQYGPDDAPRVRRAMTTLAPGVGIPPLEGDRRAATGTACCAGGRRCSCRAAAARTAAGRERRRSAAAPPERAATRRRPAPAPTRPPDDGAARPRRPANLLGWPARGHAVDGRPARCGRAGLRRPSAARTRPTTCSSTCCSRGDDDAGTASCVGAGVVPGRATRALVRLGGADRRPEPVQLSPRPTPATAVLALLVAALPASDVDTLVVVPRARHRPGRCTAQAATRAACRCPTRATASTACASSTAPAGATGDRLRGARRRRRPRRGRSTDGAGAPTCSAA